MKKKIKITISGSAATGKSTIATLISEMLNRLDIENEIDTYDYDTIDTQFVMDTLDRRIELMRDRIEVQIEERQAYTSFLDGKEKIVEKRKKDEVEKWYRYSQYGKSRYYHDEDCY